MRTLMMMISAMMMKSCNHHLMMLTRSFSLWTPLKVKFSDLPQSIYNHYISTMSMFSLFSVQFFLHVALQAADPLRFQDLTQTLDFRYQAIANGVAQHAEQRRVEIENEKLAKAPEVAVTA